MPARSENQGRIRKGNVTRCMLIESYFNNHTLTVMKTSSMGGVAWTGIGRWRSMFGIEQRRMRKGSGVDMMKCGELNADFV
jgi:hypothetical protein